MLGIDYKIKNDEADEYFGPKWHIKPAENASAISAESQRYQTAWQHNAQEKHIGPAEQKICPPPRQPAKTSARKTGSCWLMKSIILPQFWCQTNLRGGVDSRARQRIEAEIFRQYIE